MSLTFDIPATAVQTYKIIWSERQYIAKLLIVPVVVKFICLIAVLFSGASSDPIRESLIMLPSYFLDGWLIAQFIRSYLTGERWPYPVDLTTIQNEVAIIRRVRALLSCIICFVLTQMGLALLKNGMTGALANPMQEAAQNLSAQDHMNVLMALMIIILFFRLLWAPIAFAANVSLKEFTNITKGFLASLQLFAIYLIVTLPVAILFLVIISVLVGDALANLNQNMIILSVVALIGAFRDIFASLVPMVAIAIILKPAFKIS